MLAQKHVVFVQQTFFIRQGIDSNYWSWNIKNSFTFIGINMILGTLTTESKEAFDTIRFWVDF